jgi:hypothetical protein
LACAACAGACAETVKTAGSVAAEGRLFAGPPRYPGQQRGDGVSLVAEPELSLASADGAHAAKLRPFYRLDPNDERRSHADLREATYKLAGEHLEASAGVGVFTWGALESYRPVDVLNQVDFVEASGYGAKLGQPFAELGWVGEAASLKVYYLPYFRDRTFPGVRGRLRFPAAVDVDRPQFETAAGPWTPSGAARFAWSVGDVDLGVGAFAGLSREPRFVAELSTGQIAPRYETMQQASLDAQWALGALNLKVEGFARRWRPGRHFAGGGAGVDYTFFKAFAEADVSLAAELLFDARPLGAPLTFFEHDAFAGLRVALNDLANTELTAGALVDLLDATTFGRAELSRRFGEHWRAAVAANAFFGRPGPAHGAFLADDYALARLAYFFLGRSVGRW